MLLGCTTHDGARHPRLIHLRHRLIGDRERRPVDIPPAPLDNIQLPVRPADAPLADCIARHPFHRHAFKDVVVDLLVMGLHGNLPRSLRIPDRYIRIRPDADEPLARIDVENLRRIGRGHPHELARREPAGVDAVVPQDRHAVFHAAGAVRDLAEVVAARRFLVVAEAAVVGRRCL